MFVPEINTATQNHQTATIQELTKHIKKKTGCACEVLYGPVIPYYDFDDANYTTEEKQKNRLLPDLRDAFNKLKVVAKVGKEADVLSFMSCGYDKEKNKYRNRFHFRVRGAAYYSCGADVPQIKGFDQSPYKQEGKRQLLRLSYCSKNGQNRKLKRVWLDDDDYFVIDKLENCKVELSETLGDYLVSNIMNEKLNTVATEEEKKEDGKDHDEGHVIHDQWDVISTASTTPNENLQYSQTNIEDLMECLNVEEQQWEWDYWTKVVWGLRNVADENNLDPLDLVHKISAYSYSSKYDESNTDKIYDAKDKNPPSKPIGIGTWIKFAKAG